MSKYRKTKPSTHIWRKEYHKYYKKYKGFHCSADSYNSGGYSKLLSELLSANVVRTYYMCILEESCMFALNYCETNKFWNHIKLC